MVISMNRDDVVTLKGGLISGLRSITLRCVKGTVWVTIAGDSTDYILSAGKELTVSKKGKIVIMAEENASLRFFRPVTASVLKHMGFNEGSPGSVCQEMKSR